MQDKKEAVLGKKSAGKSASKMIAALIVAVVVIAGGAYVFMNSGGQSGDAVATSSNSGANSGTSASTGGDQVIRIEAAQFEDGKARHFVYDAGGDLQIRFFVLKSSDGMIRAAFDACDVCWRSGKGYAQDGDDMVCQNCGQRFPSVKVNEVKGGCNPSPLQRLVQDGKVVIRVADILAGKQYFDFLS